MKIKDFSVSLHHSNACITMKSYIKVILLLLIPLLMIASYSLWGGEWGLEKVDFSDVEVWLDSFEQQEKAEAPLPVEAPPVAADTLSAVSEPVAPAPLDTTPQRILFIGDSMLEGLSRRMCDYAMHNGHELTSVVWYSSTSQVWAECDTLEHFIRTASPTFVAVCLCSNELFVRDLKERDAYIRRVVEKIGDLPFVWISPPNWKEDTGINDLIVKNVGSDRYFDSRGLELKRGSDKIHPTFDAAAVWMDSVAVWMSGESTKHPIVMDVPVEKRPRKFRQILLMPPN